MAPARRVRGGAAALTVALAAVIALPALAGAPAATCAAAGEIRVRVVVDFGGAAGAPASVSDVCVGADDGATGAEVLAARARQLGTPAPRYDGGFLCGLDGFPETGCRERSGDGFRYWSYWHGEAGSWTYANVGAGSWKLHEGDVEGWRFVDGGPESKAVPPRAVATACATTPTTAPRSPAATATPTVAPAPVTTSSPPAAATPTPTTTPPAATTTAAGAAATTTTAAAGAAARNETADVGEAASARDGGDGAGPLGLLVVGGAVVALAVAAGLRFRGRSSQ